MAPLARAPRKSRSVPGNTHVATAERPYTDDEREYLAAIESFKARTGRRFPAWTEALQVARELGYRKDGA